MGSFSTNIFTEKGSLFLCFHFLFSDSKIKMDAAVFPTRRLYSSTPQSELGLIFGIFTSPSIVIMLLVYHNTVKQHCSGGSATNPYNPTNPYRGDTGWFSRDVRFRDALQRVKKFKRRSLLPKEEKSILRALSLHLYLLSSSIKRASGLSSVRLFLKNGTIPGRLPQRLGFFYLNKRHSLGLHHFSDTLRT